MEGYDETVAEVHREEEILAYLFLTADDWVFTTGNLFRRRRRQERRLSWELHFTDPARLPENGLLEDEAVANLGEAKFIYRGHECRLQWLYGRDVGAAAPSELCTHAADKTRCGERRAPAGALRYASHHPFELAPRSEGTFPLFTQLAG